MPQNDSYRDDSAACGGVYRISYINAYNRDIRSFREHKETESMTKKTGLIDTDGRRESGTVDGEGGCRER
jgi:hypothetical protein